MTLYGVFVTWEQEGVMTVEATSESDAKAIARMLMEAGTGNIKADQGGVSDVKSAWPITSPDAEDEAQAQENSEALSDIEE